MLNHLLNQGFIVLYICLKKDLMFYEETNHLSRYKYFQTCSACSAELSNNYHIKKQTKAPKHDKSIKRANDYAIPFVK